MSDPTFPIYGATDQDVIDAIAVYTAASSRPPRLTLYGRSRQREDERQKRHRENHEKHAREVVPDALDFIRGCIEPQDDDSAIEERAVAYCKARAIERATFGVIFSPFWIGIVARIALLVIRIWLNGGLKPWAIAERQRMTAG